MAHTHTDIVDAGRIVCSIIIIIIIIIHEYCYGGAVALLLQDHLTMSVSRRESIYREHSLNSTVFSS